MNAFAALADDTRRDIVVLLARNGELPVSEISRNFEMTAPAVSQHLKVLKEANVIQMRKDAQRRLYSLDASGLAEIEKWIEDLRKIWNSRLNSLDEYLKKMKKDRKIGKE